MNFQKYVPKLRQKASTMKGKVPEGKRPLLQAKSLTIQYNKI
jgi:hypothetical protein